MKAQEVTDVKRESAHSAFPRKGDKQFAVRELGDAGAAAERASKQQT